LLCGGIVDTKKETGKQTYTMEMLDDLKEQASLDSISKFIDFISHRAKQLGYSEERINEMERAFTEVFTNIVTYAFREVSGDIEISYSIDRADRMVFKIIDWGAPFNMLLASGPLLKEEFLEQGIPQPSTRLIKKLTDTVEYQRLENMNYLLATFSPVVKGGT
jgi:anti-sigma regulatory factor (Ser/Thr protein kinase)